MSQAHSGSIATEISPSAQLQPEKFTSQQSLKELASLRGFLFSIESSRNRVQTVPVKSFFFLPFFLLNNSIKAFSKDPSGHHDMREDERKKRERERDNVIVWKKKKT